MATEDCSCHFGGKSGHHSIKDVEWVRVLVLNATFNNISVISWRSVLGVEETEYPEKTTDLLQYTDKLFHKKVAFHKRWSILRTGLIRGYYYIPLHSSKQDVN
jgi:hypothetical protein